MLFRNILNKFAYNIKINYMSNLFDLNSETKEVKVNTTGLKTLLSNIGDGVIKIMFNSFFNEIIIFFKPPTNNAISVLDWSNLDDILSSTARDNNNLFTYSINSENNIVEITIDDNIGNITE